MNTISALLANPFSSRDPEEQLQIKELGRPTPLLNLSNAQNDKDSTWKYDIPEIYSQHEWIAGCALNDALYCFPCVLFSGESVWATTGYKDLIHLSNAITKHEIDANHIHNVINYSCIGKKSTNEQKKATERRNIEVERNLHVLKLLIDSIKFCGQGYIPIMKKIYDKDDEDYYMTDNDAFQELLELVYDFKNLLKMDIFKTDLESMKEDIVNAAFEVYQAEVVEEINRAECLAIIIEDLGGFNDDYLKVLILRYVVDGKVVERIWKFLKYEEDACFFETLEEELKLILNNPMKLISHSYQTLNLKEHSLRYSLHSRVNKIYRSAQLVHFYRHDLHDIIVNTSDFDIQVRTFLYRVWNICDFFVKEPWAKKSIEVFEKIVNGGSKQTWDFMEDRLNKVYYYTNELLETMDEIQNDTFSYPCISKAYSLALDLEDEDFQFWLETFHKIIPHIEYYLNEYESCLKPLDPENSFSITRENIEKILSGEAQVPSDIVYPSEIQVKIEEDLEIFESNMEDVKVEMEATPSEEALDEKPSCSTISDVSRKRKLIDNKKELEVDVVNIIMLHLQERLKFRGHTFASRLVDPKNFQQYNSDFPESFFEITLQCFPLSTRLRSELEVLYERVEFRSLDGSCSLMKDILERKLQSTFQQTMKLLNIVLTIPIKSTEPSRCFSTLTEAEFYLKNCRDPELLHSLLPLACEKEFIDNIFEFNKKVVQIFAEKPGRARHFKRQTLPE